MTDRQLRRTSALHIIEDLRNLRRPKNEKVCKLVSQNIYKEGIDLDTDVATDSKLVEKRLQNNSANYLSVEFTLT